MSYLLFAVFFAALAVLMIAAAGTSLIGAVLALGFALMAALATFSATRLA